MIRKNTALLEKAAGTGIVEIWELVGKAMKDSGQDVLQKVCQKLSLSGNDLEFIREVWA